MVVSSVIGMIATDDVSFTYKLIEFPVFEIIFPASKVEPAGFPQNLEKRWILDAFNDHLQETRTSEVKLFDFFSDWEVIVTAVMSTGVMKTFLAFAGMF